MKRAKRARRVARALQVLAIALAVGWAAGSKTSAWAQAVSNVPRAGSSIGNQASATYTDGSGATRTATSNTVQTIVTQVAGVSLTQDAGCSRGDGPTGLFSARGFQHRQRAQHLHARGD